MIAQPVADDAHVPKEPLSNRTPTRDELQQGAPALALLAKAFPHARWIAVGNKAEQAMHTLQDVAFERVRHPVNGGATQFREQVARIARERRR